MDIRQPEACHAHERCARDGREKIDVSSGFKMEKFRRRVEMESGRAYLRLVLAAHIVLSDSLWYTDL
jgi:hypothetical protein